MEGVALGKTVPTTRLAVFGTFVEWETNLLTGLMSGRIDHSEPTPGAMKSDVVSLSGTLPLAK